MTREETQRVLMVIQTAFPNYHVPDKTAAVDLWGQALSDLTYEQVSGAVTRFIMTDTKGFAPSIGQIREIVCLPTETTSEAEAWNMVYEAICNSNYHANEEFNKLPEDIRRAVGGPSQLREWAVMDLESITVAESNFKRSYRAVSERNREYAKLPQSMRPMIGNAPLAQIEAGSEKKTNGESADPERAREMIDNLLKKWEGADGGETDDV